MRLQNEWLFLFREGFYGCDYATTKRTFFIQMIGEYINGSDAHTRDDLREHYTLPHYLKWNLLSNP